MRFVLSLFIFLTTGFGQVITAQADSILSLPNYRQLTALHLWYNTFDKSDSAAVLFKLRELKDVFSQNNAKTLVQQCQLLEINYLVLNYHHADLNWLDFLHSKIDEALDRKHFALAGEIYITIGAIHHKHSRWGPAFENILKGHALLDTHGYEAFPHTRKHLFFIGLVYYKFGEVRSAIPFFRRCVLDPIASELRINHFNTYNTLALCYQKEMEYDSAMYFYRLAYEDAVASGNDYWAILIQGNIGHLFFEQGNYDEALPLMEKDYTESLKAEEIGSAINAALLLSTIYLSKKEYEKAEACLQFVRTSIKAKDVRAFARYYDNSYRFFKERGQYATAVHYADSARTMEERIRKETDVTFLDKARLKVEVERHDASIKRLEMARKRQVLIRNGALLILGLTTIIMFQFFQRQNLKRKKEYELAALKATMANDALEAARRELDGYTRNLREKNKLIEDISHEMEALRLAGLHQEDERTARFQKLLQSTILTEDDWVEFRTRFEKVYPGFFLHLRETMPELTPADTRLLALTKLKLTSKEMAAALGIGVESIKKSRQRLRRRLQLPEEGSLDELIEGL